MRPSKTLFVINFDPIHTRPKDLERHFDSYGKIANIRIRRNFAFVQYETQEDATRALDATNMRFDCLEDFRFILLYGVLEIVTVKVCLVVVLKIIYIP